jgi:hypothetical protein
MRKEDDWDINALKRGLDGLIKIAIRRGMPLRHPSLLDARDARDFYDQEDDNATLTVDDVNRLIESIRILSDALSYQVTKKVRPASDVGNKAKKR